MLLIVRLAFRYCRAGNGIASAFGKGWQCPADFRKTFRRCNGKRTLRRHAGQAHDLDFERKIGLPLDRIRVNRSETLACVVNPFASGPSDIDTTRTS
jgi:hypothetical protein